jgi:hypothetical protein
LFSTCRVTSSRSCLDISMSFRLYIPVSSLVLVAFDRHK